MGFQVLILGRLRDWWVFEHRDKCVFELRDWWVFKTQKGAPTFYLLPNAAEKSTGFSQMRSLALARGHQI